MSYVTPITDRTGADILAKTSKAFFNVADWTRIYGNAELAISLLNIMEGPMISFPSIAAPTTASIPSVTNLNSLLSAIEAARGDVGFPTVVKDDYVAGVNEEAPDYIDVNLWESAIDAVWTYYNGASLDVCPTLAADLTVLTGTMKIIIDCLDTGTYDIDLQGTADLAII